MYTVFHTYFVSLLNSYYHNPRIKLYQKKKKKKKKGPHPKHTNAALCCPVTILLPEPACPQPSVVPSGFHARPAQSPLSIKPHPARPNRYASHTNHQDP